jgi:hypothetical protein
LNAHGIEARKRLQYANEVASSRACPGAQILTMVRLTLRFVIVPVCVDITGTGVFCVVANRRWASRVQLRTGRFGSSVDVAIASHICMRMVTGVFRHSPSLIVTTAMVSDETDSRTLCWLGH